MGPYGVAQGAATAGVPPVRSQVASPTETPQTQTATSAPLTSRPAIELPGIRADGRVQLPNQWSLQPTGRQVVLGDFPVNIAVHPDGKYVAVLHAGFSQHEVIVLELTGDRAAIRSRSALEAAFYGLCWSADGARLFCSGGPKERIEAFEFAAGQLGRRSELSVFAPPAGSKPARPRKDEPACVPAGIALSRDGRTLYVAGNRGHEVVALSIATTYRPDVPASTGPSAETPPPLHIKLPADSFPYGCILDEERGRLYVSLWGQARVAVFKVPLTAASAPAEYWPTEDHPNEMLLTRDGGTLYVANANRNTVSAIDTATGRTRELLCSALFPDAPNGSTPNSIALSLDEKTLYIANADNNNIAVMDVAIPGRAQSRGFIPVGWYPTSVRLTPDGKHLLVANGKGTTPKANRNGPRPAASRRDHRGVHRQPVPRHAERDQDAGGRGGAAQADREGLSVQPIARRPAARRRAAGRQPHPRRRPRPINPPSLPGRGWGRVAGPRRPARPRHPPIRRPPASPSPIRYVLYIIKENRTYDQVLGDMPEGHGDAALCLFGEDVTPNLHALAREFVLLDNFYVEAEVSADGHEWSMGAYATDFVEKYWPLNYSGKDYGKIGYPSEGDFKIGAPTAGYIWDRCAAAGLSYRSFGEFIARREGRLVAKVDALREHFDPEYEPFNTDVSDQKRADRFIAELQRFEREDALPRFIVLHLPDDHTVGTSVGKPTPIAMVADNDLALGRIVAAVSRSKFWPQMAIFVVEDDAQNGSDHIDAHRTTAFVISPYVRRHTVDSSLYSTTSMLRTIELILGLPPMSQFDAAARPMYASFGPQPDLRPYVCRPARVDLQAQNTALAWGADRSARFDFSKEGRRR